MSDSINGLGRPAAPTPSRAPSTPSSTRTGQVPETAGSDSVQLTDAARQLQSFELSAGTTPPFDGPRVDAIRQALDDGSYTVDSQQIAERLLQFDN